MEAKDLRIGNLISIGLDIGIVTDITIDGVVKIQKSLDTWVSAPIERFDPIPLSEEWLLKFGFVCHSDGYCHLPSKGISFNDYNSNMINLCVGKYCQEGEDLPHIKHVHQLQSLYWGLCGEELTLINE